MQSAMGQPADLTPPTNNGQSFMTEGTQAERKLAEALRAFISEVGTPRPKREREGPKLRAFVVLVVLVIDLSAVGVLLADLLREPIVDVAAKLLPGVLGTMLATFAERTRKALVDAAQGMVLPIIAFLGLIAVVLVVFPYNVRLHMRQGTEISLDDAEFFQPALEDSVARVSVRRLTDHRLTVREFYPAFDKEDTATYHFGRRELMQSLFLRRVFSVGIRPTVILTRPRDATSIVVGGDLPELYLAHARYKKWIVTRDKLGRSEVSLPTSADLTSVDVALPEGGPWTLQVIGSDRKRSCPVFVTATLDSVPNREIPNTC